MKEIPVYLFQGFLESGKTTFIREILADPNFTEEERSLLIVCEDGIESYDPQFLHDAQTEVVYVEDWEQLNLRYFRELGEQYAPDRILIEWNGMWDVSTFLEEKFPPEWPVYQMVTTVNAQTFSLYSNNLGPKMFAHLTTADLIVFNRCTDALKDMLHQKNIRAMNPRATIFLDDIDGNTEDYRENMQLPFDLDAPVIEISDADFGLWYVDVTGSPEKYAGKTIRIKAMAYKAPKLDTDEFVAGRFGMVCCADDITFIGAICRDADLSRFADKSWLSITARVEVGAHPQYRGEGPILYCQSIAPAEKPDEEIVYFN